MESWTKWQLTMSCLIGNDIWLGVNSRIDSVFFYFTWPREHHMAMYLSINAMSMKREREKARYQEENWRSSIVWTLLSLYMWALVERKRGLEQWSMTWEDVYTLKLNVYDHMYVLSNVSFSFSSSSSFFASFFSIRQSTNNDEWQQKVLINQESC